MTTSTELAQGRLDVLKDPDLGKHSDRHVARRHNVRIEIVREVRKSMGIAEPPRRSSRIDWSKYKTKAT